MTNEQATAIVNALGAIVFATVRALPPALRERYANDLAQMAHARAGVADTEAAKLLIDLADAARTAATE